MKKSPYMIFATLFFSILSLATSYATTETTKTTITGVIKNAKFNIYYKTARLRSYAYERRNDTLFASCPVNSDSTFVLNFDLAEPQLLKLNNTDVWVTPGDNVKVETDGFEITTVTGTNAGNYWISSELYRQIPSISISERYMENWSNYFRDLRSIRERRQVLLPALMQQQETSAAFRHFMHNELKYDFLKDAMNAYFSSSVARAFFDQNIELDAEDFNRDDAFVCPSYPMALSFYYDYVTLSSGLKKVTNEKDKLKLENALIDKNFIGRSREALKLMRLRDYALQYVEHYEAILDSLLSLSAKNFNYIKYRNDLNTLRDYYKVTDRPFPTNVMEIELTNGDDAKVQFRDIMEKHKGKTILVDFWASWCTYCLDELPHFEFLKNKIDTSKVVIVYFSIDRNKDKWKDGLKEHTDQNEQYWLGERSQLERHLMVTGIPRFVILNKNQNMALFKAPQPSGNIEKLVALIDEINKK